MATTDSYTLPTVPRNRRALAGGGLAALVLLTGGGAAKVAQSASGSSTECKNPAIVQVVAPEQIANAVQSAAQQVEDAGNVCAQYTVTAQNPGATYEEIVKSPSSAPSLWITDSPVWIDLVNKKLGAGWLTSGDVFATSPVVLGVPASRRAEMETLPKPSWYDAMQQKYPVAFIDTDQSSASLLNVIAANQQAMTREDRAQLMQNILRISRSQTTANTMIEKAKLGADRAVVYPISEQQMLSFNGANPGAKLTPIVPTGGAQKLEYQTVTPVRGQSVPTAAVKALQDQLASPAIQSMLAVDGFRGASGAPLQNSPLPSNLTYMKPAKPEEIVGADTAWNNLKKDARMLVLIDVSGSMNTLVQPGQTRIDLLQKMAVTAVDVLPPTTRLGAWGFSSDLQPGHKDYLEVVKGEPPLTTKAARDDLKQKSNIIQQLVARNGDTGLYDSIAAAYDSVSSTYSPSYINSVVVMTDGANDDPNGGLSLDELLAHLRKKYDPNKPVKIVTIAISNQADPAALKKIANATDGLSYVTTSPDQIASVFVDAFLRRTS